MGQTTTNNRQPTTDNQHPESRATSAPSLAWLGWGWAGLGWVWTELSNKLKFITVQVVSSRSGHCLAQPIPSPAQPSPSPAPALPSKAKLGAEIALDLGCCSFVRSID